MADNDKPDDKFDAIMDRMDTSGAHNAYQVLENPSRDWPGRPEMVPEMLHEKYGRLISDLQSLQDRHHTSEPDYGVLGNIPGTDQPITKQYLQQEFSGKAGALLLKLADPKYGLTADGVPDFSAMPANDLKTLNAYLVIAAGGAADAKPDYALLTNPADGKPIVNPATNKPYTADDIRNLQINLDMREIKALVAEHTTHETGVVKLDALRHENEKHGIENPPYRGDNFESSFNDDVSAALTGMLGMDAKGANTAQTIMNVKFHALHPNTPVEVTYDSLKHSIFMSDALPPATDPNVSAALEAFKRVQDGKGEIPLTPPGSPTQPAPTPAAPPASGPVKNGPAK